MGANPFVLLIVACDAPLVVLAVQNQLDHEDMSPECKKEVVRDQNRMAQDYRLNWRLKTACSSDISKLCAGMCNEKDGQMCGGVVLQCLQVRWLGWWRQWACHRRACYSCPVWVLQPWAV